MSFRARMILWIVVLLVIAVLDWPPVPSISVGGGSYLLLFWRELGRNRTPDKEGSRWTPKR